MKDNEKWVVHGFYGQRNFGDDLFCVIMSRLFERKSVAYAVLNSDVKTRFSIRSLKMPLLNAHVSKNNKLGRIARVVSNLLSVIVADVVVYGGGSLFGRYASLKQRKLITTFASVLGKEVYAFGVSIGPFESSGEKREFQKVLSRFQMVFVRDESSFKYGREMICEKAHRAPDMAWALPDIIPKTKKEVNCLVVALHILADREYVGSIIELADNFDEIVVLALDEGAEEVSEWISSQFEKRNMPATYIRYFDVDIEDVVEIIGSAAFVITTKLHGAIVSRAYGVRCALLEYQEKCTEFQRTVGIGEEYLNHGVEEIYYRTLNSFYFSDDLSCAGTEHNAQYVLESFDNMLVSRK